MGEEEWTTLFEFVREGSEATIVIAKLSPESFSLEVLEC
jgi:hypothetical protein